MGTSPPRSSGGAEGSQPTSRFRAGPGHEMKNDDPNLAFTRIGHTDGQEDHLGDGWPGDRSGPIHV